MNAPLKHNTDLSLVFLDCLDKVGRHDLVAINPESGALSCATFGHDEPEALRRWIDERQGRLNLYLSVNAARDSAAKHERLDKQNIGALRAVVADVDCKKTRDGTPGAPL
jgi:hypothetical protein